LVEPFDRGERERERERESQTEQQTGESERQREKDRFLSFINTLILFCLTSFEGK
jgi:hypothetical protein